MTDVEKDRHDFKNHLGVIFGFAEILIAETAADDPRRADLMEVHKASKAALDLLARLYPEHPETTR